LAAVVVFENGTATLDDLRSYCQDFGLAKAKWPEFVTEIDVIPLSAIGKVLRGELEDLVWKIVREK
jgi:non-ribosomal peptide synthetase component E (peptide arylation enzyme)